MEMKNIPTGKNISKEIRIWILQCYVWSGDMDYLKSYEKETGSRTNVVFEESVICYKFTGQIK